jgi:formamidopyrimidine-DNA glycosylase
LCDVLRASITNRGTTFSDYRDGRGDRGLHQVQLAVYRRTGQPCPRCGTQIERLRFGGRGSHFCPNCQPC